MDDAAEFVVVLTGEVDYARKDELGDYATRFEDSDAAGARIDMSGVTFLDSRGLSFLVSMRNIADARGGHVRIVDPPVQVTDLLRLVNLDGRFLVVSTGPHEPPR